MSSHPTFDMNFSFHPITCLVIPSWISLNVFALDRPPTIGRSTSLYPKTSTSSTTGLGHDYPKVNFFMVQGFQAIIQWCGSGCEKHCQENINSHGPEASITTNYGGN